MKYKRYKNDKCGIYFIINIINGKFYIGSSCSILNRWWKHRTHLNKNVHDNIHLQNAWNKYGSNKFLFEVYYECPIDNLLGNEQFLLDEFWGKEQCYNISKDASCATRGRPRSEETKKRISMGIKNSDHLEIMRSLKTRENMSRSHIGSKHSAETIEKFKNRVFTKERNKKIGDSHRGIVFSKDRCNSISIAKLKSKKVYTEEEKRRISEGVQKAIREGRYHKNKIPKSEYNTIKTLYFSGKYTKSKLADIYKVNIVSISRIIDRIEDNQTITV